VPCIASIVLMWLLLLSGLLVDAGTAHAATWHGDDSGNRRLTSATRSATALAAGAPFTVVKMRYDSAGRLYSRESFASPAALAANQPDTTTLFLRNGWNTVAEYSRNGTTLTLKTTYLNGLDVSGSLGGAGGIGGLLAITSHSPLVTSHYPVHDGNGNLTGLIDGTTWQNAASYEYGPFGETLRATGPEAAANRLRYSGKYTDPATGLLYFGHRWYDPETGRWLTREPLGESESVNLFAYCHNDPINKVDVLGLAEWYQRKIEAEMAYRYAMDHNGRGMPVDLRVELRNDERMSNTAKVIVGSWDALLNIPSESERMLSPKEPLGHGVGHNLTLGANTLFDELISLQMMLESPRRAIRGEELPEHVVWAKNAYIQNYTTSERGNASTALFATSVFGPAAVNCGTRFVGGLYRASGARGTAMCVERAGTAFNHANFADDVARIRAESVRRHGLNFPGAERAMLMAGPDPVAAGAAKGFSNLQCFECAAAIKKALSKAGLHGEEIIMRYPSSPGFIVRQNGATVSRNGVHKGIIYDGRVYDNHFPEGLPVQQ